MLNLVPVKESEIYQLAEMASKIWHEYFPSVISEAQIDYMVERFQSAPAMRDQISNHNYHYYFIKFDGIRIGYTALVPEGDALFISKLYLSRAYRGRGLGTEAIKSIFGICLDKGYRSAYLTVNRGNAMAIRAYERNGFRTVRSQATDIGRGFVMDDYVMEKVF